MGFLERALLREISELWVVDMNIKLSQQYRIKPWWGMACQRSCSEWRSAKQEASTWIEILKLKILLCDNFSSVCWLDVLSLKLHTSTHSWSPSWRRWRSRTYIGEMATVKLEQCCQNLLVIGHLVNLHSTIFIIHCTSGFVWLRLSISKGLIHSLYGIEMCLGAWIFLVCRSWPLVSTSYSLSFTSSPCSQGCMPIFSYSIFLSEDMKGCTSGSSVVLHVSKGL